MPKRASTPASSAEASAIGMRSITRSNQPVTPDQRDQRAADDEGADRLGHRDARCAAWPAPPRPAWTRRSAPAAGSHSDRPMLREPHAEAQRPHPGGDLRRRGAERLRGLEHDRHRTGEAHQHRDEAGHDRRRGRGRFSNCASMRGQRGRSSRAGTPAAGWHRTPGPGAVRSPLSSPARRRGCSAGSGSRPPRRRCGASGEQLFAPRRHAAADGGDDDVARQEVAGLHLVELAAPRGRSSSSARGTSGSFLKPKCSDHLPAVVAQRLDLDALVEADPGHLVVAHGDEQVVLVQHLVVLEVVQQRVGRRCPARPSGTPPCRTRASAG